MNLLALETSTAVGSIALFKDGELIGTKKSDNPKKHTEFVATAIEDLLLQAHLQLKDLDRFAVSIGPGSFTGIRVAVNSVRTYAQLLDRPVFCANSLEILAEQTTRPTICLLNAYKNMIYFAAYDKKCLFAPTAIRIAELNEILSKIGIYSPTLFVGDGFIFYEKFLRDNLSDLILRDENLSDYPLAETLGRMALKKTAQTNDWKSIIPLYIRASEAEENLRKK